MLPGGERPPRAALPRQLSPAGEESAGAGSKSPAQPRGTPGRGPAFWLLLALGGRWGDSYTWGGKFRLVVGAGAGARRGGLCAPVGLGMGRGEMEGWSGSGSLPPHTCSPDLGLPGMKVLASRSEAPPLSKLTRLVSWQRRPGSGLRSGCSPSDKGFPAYLLMA